MTALSKTRSPLSWGLKDTSWSWGVCPASQCGGEGIRHDRAGGLWESGQSRVLGGNDMMGPECQEPLHGGAA